MEDLEPYGMPLLPTIYLNLNLQFILDQFLNPFNPSPIRPMHEWENHEVVDFILNEISIESHEITNGNLQCFQNISGYIFRNLSEENCKQLSNSNSIGELIYNAKETYIRRQPIECKFRLIGNLICCDISIIDFSKFLSLIKISYYSIN